MEHTKNNVVIWSWYPNDELDVAELIGFDLYGDAVVKRRYYDKNRFRENDFNVIVINHFFNDYGKPRGKEDLYFADLIIHYTTEVLFGPWEKYKKVLQAHFNNHKNIITICNGVSNMDTYPNDRVYIDAQSFFTRIANFCKAPAIKNMPESKIKLFDALLGKQDGRRHKLFDKLKENNLLDSSFVNLFKDDGNDNIENVYRSQDLDLYEDHRLIGIKHGSAKFVEHLENGRSMSHSIPKRIYENSWYSLVAETNSGTTFITEKTTKCLLAGRIFVMFAEQGTLAKLKQYGYRTFNNIIDESYDNEANEDLRFAMAFEQVEKLARIQDHRMVYKKMRETLKHNQRTMLDHPARLQGIKDFLLPHLKVPKK